MSPLYYIHNPVDPFVDTKFGFNMALNACSQYPDIHIDTYGTNISQILFQYWPHNSIPNVATFKPNDKGNVIYTYNSSYPDISVLQNEPVGIQTITDEAETYLFGFHLYYMIPEDAKKLVDYLYQGSITLTPHTLIEPDTLKVIQANSLFPVPLQIYLGDFGDTLSVTDIDPASVKINGILSPATIETIPSYPDFATDILLCTLPLRDFILYYGWVFGTSLRSYTISGNFTDNNPFQYEGHFTLIGHRPGDFNLDNKIDITDLVATVSYFYENGTAPEIIESIDMNFDNQLDITDLIAMINYFFSG